MCINFFLVLGYFAKMLNESLNSSCNFKNLLDDDSSDSASQKNKKIRLNEKTSFTCSLPQFDDDLQMSLMKNLGLGLDSNFESKKNQPPEKLNKKKEIHENDNLDDKDTNIKKGESSFDIEDDEVKNVETSNGKYSADDDDDDDDDIVMLKVDITDSKVCQQNFEVSWLLLAIYIIQSTILNVKNLYN